MSTSKIWKMLATLMVLSVVVSACSGGAQPTATQAPAVSATAPANSTGPTDTPAPTAGTQLVTASGFVCPPVQNKATLTSKELDLFVWTEYIPQDMIDCFQLIYGIKVNRDEYSSNEDMYAKLSAGGVSYDMVQPTDYMISLMVRQKMLQKIDKTRFLDMANFDPNYLGLAFDPNNDYTIPWEAGTDSLVYDSATVPDPPKSWADLWKPEYAGHMVLLDDSRAVIGFTLLTLGYDVNTTDTKQLAEAKTKLAQLVKGVKLFDSDSPKTALIAGDVNVGNTWTGEAFLAQKEKPTITFVYPTEGSILWQDSFVITKDASHLDAVYAWLNYIYQGDVFWLMLRDYTYTNPDQAALAYAKDNQADLYNAYINSTITNVPKDALLKGHRIDDVGDAVKIYDQIWTEVKGGN